MTDIEKFNATNKRKIFIFLTQTICGIGGMEMYIAGKAKYLESIGWEVYIFVPEPRDSKSIIPSLDKYFKDGGGCVFLQKPPYKFRRWEQEHYLNMMIQSLNVRNFYECEIIFESPYGVVSYWAELFAAKIGGRNFFTALDEKYPREFSWHLVEDNLDFFYFKWKRNELICRSAGLVKLFNGYKNVTAPLYDMPTTVREMDPVQDVDFNIDALPKFDWNICHIGRAIKDYVPYVIKGVGELAKRHPDKTVHLIMVGNAAYRMELMQQTFSGMTNIRVTLLGDMVPIPRVLFKKIDVVCAIAQSAMFAANEGVLTIVGNANNPERTPGVLGYDTEERTFGEPTFTYVEALENVLVKKLYDGKEYSLPKLRPAEESYDNFWTIVKNADPKKEYYVERLSQERIREWTAIFPFGMIARGARIIFAGETVIARDYRKQIESQKNYSVEFGRDYVKQFKPTPYCQVVATVDEHPEEFDDEIVGLERLKQKDYDAIVVTTFPQNAQALCNKIAKIVPDMANRIIYNFQVVSA